MSMMGNKLRVVERIPVVMCKPVFKLHFAETQQGCFRVCGLLAVIPARRWRNVRGRVAAVKGRWFLGWKTQSDAPRLAGARVINPAVRESGLSNARSEG